MSKTSIPICNLCDPPRKCSNAQGYAAHVRSAHSEEWLKTHPITEPKKSKKPSKGKRIVSLQDAILALEIKKDSLEEVIQTLRKMI